MSPLWLLLALIALGAVSGTAAWRNRREAAALRGLARRLRLNFSTVDLIGLHARYNSLQLIRRGHQRHARHVLYGSTGTGLVALFRYSYDLGFGAARTMRHVWMAVLETAAAHKPWRLGPPGPWDPETSGGAVAEPVLLAGHAETRRRLSEPSVRELLAQAPAGSEWEACGRVLAVAAPADAGTEMPERLLTLLQTMAGLLEAELGMRT